MNYKWITGCAVTLIFIFTGASAHAQFQQPPQQQPQPIEVSDDELLMFVQASMQAQQIQTDSQMEMIAIVEEEGLEVETYNEIFQGMQMGQSPDELDVTSEQIESFEKASELIGEIEQEMEIELIAAIEGEGIELERFQEIFTAIQTDPALQQKLQQMIQETQMQQSGQPQPENY